MALVVKTTVCDYIKLYDYVWCDKSSGMSLVIMDVNLNRYFSIKLFLVNSNNRYYSCICFCPNNTTLLHEMKDIFG